MQKINNNRNGGMQLPIHIQKYILIHLDYKDALIAKKCCSAFYTIFEEPNIKKHYMMKQEIDKLEQGIIDKTITKSFDVSQALAQSALCKAKIGDIEGAEANCIKAKEAAEGILYNRYKGYCLTDIAKAQAEARLIAQAKETAESVVDNVKKVDALSAIAAAEARAGDLEGAKATFQQAKETTATIDKYHTKTCALSHIAVGKAKAGDIDAAKETFQEAKDAAVAITGPFSSARAFFLKDIAVEQAKAGFIDEEKATLKLAKEIDATISHPVSKAGAREFIKKK